MEGCFVCTFDLNERLIKPGSQYQTPATVLAKKTYQNLVQVFVKTNGVPRSRRATLLGLKDKPSHRPRGVEVQDGLALGLLRLEAFLVD